MDRSVELELRKDIKEINEKVTDLQVSLNDKMSDIKLSLGELKVKQNTAFNLGAWIIQIIVTVIVGGIGGIASTHFPK